MFFVPAGYYTFRHIPLPVIVIVIKAKEKVDTVHGKKHNFLSNNFKLTEVIKN